MRPRPALDLNLLLVLDVLLTTGSVTRAAGRLGLGQPAVSGALSRLRQMFGDPLFVRAPGGMVPTPRASEIQGPLREALGLIERELLEEHAFDPRTSTRTFVLAATDYVQFLVLGRLVARAREVAPGVTLQLLPILQRFPWSELVAGEIDLVLGRAPTKPDGMRRRPLFNDRIVAVVRRDHPTVRDTLELDDYLALDHVDVLPIEAPGLADVYLQRIGRKRRVVATTPYFLVGPTMVVQTDCCLTMSERVARALSERLPLRLVELPFPAPPFAVHAYWHERVHDDVAHRFLRGLAQEAARAP